MVKCLAFVPLVRRPWVQISRRPNVPQRCKRFAIDSTFNKKLLRFVNGPC